MKRYRTNFDPKHIPYGSFKKALEYVFIGSKKDKRKYGEWLINTVNKSKARQQAKKEIKSQIEESV